MLQLILTSLNWLCGLLFVLLICLSIWYGIRIEIGKPGDNGHIIFEL